ncbi:MAG: DUF4157 domain-containing protein [Bacteroidetes bacterium]|nr:DUF4157 domain-containing protein [Bacteroidota bacterium]
MHKSSSYRTGKSAYGPSSTPGQESFFGHGEAVQTKQEEPFFQTSMMIGKPNDKYEKEADSVADKIVAKKDMEDGPAVQRQEISSIQRLSTPIEDENFSTNDQRIRNDRDIQEKPEVQTKSDTHENPKLQTKCAHCEQEEASAGVSNLIDSTRGKGQSMPESTRYQMESAFGTSFHDVNIHTGADSVGMNKELGAQAFTHGKDIYFNSGKYNPDSTSGQHLLAHELTHVVQQTGGAYRDQVQCDHDKQAHPKTKSKSAKDQPKEPPKYVVPKLSISSGSIMDEGCGELIWDAAWNIDHEAGDKGGWIIQEVSIQYQAFDCNMRPIPEKKLKSPLHYYEAWRVDPKSTDIRPELDSFAYKTKAADGSGHTLGFASWKAVAHYHDNVGENDLPDHMVRYNSKTAAGGLFSSTQDPRLGGDVSGPVPHELTYHWACCGEKGTKPNLIDHKIPS